MANQGPKTGECGHFRRLGDTQGDQSYAVRRFTDEVNRLYGVLNNRLYDRPYLAGDEYTIADMICYPWTVSWEGAGPGHQRVQIFQALVRGDGRAPAVQRGMAVTAGPTEDLATLAAGRTGAAPQSCSTTSAPGPRPRREGFSRRNRGGRSWRALNLG